MTIRFQKEKHLEASAFRRTEAGDIEVLFPEYDAFRVFLVEYELDWYIVFEDSRGDYDIEIERYESCLIENQLDIYRLNAVL